MKAEYAIHGRVMLKLVVDKESRIIPLEDKMKAEGIQLQFTATGQKVALAEVHIRIVRQKARSTKGGVRNKYNHLPPNQFNIDLCFDSVQNIKRQKSI